MTARAQYIFLKILMRSGFAPDSIQEQKLQQFLTQSIIVIDEGQTFTLQPPDLPFEWIRVLDEYGVLSTVADREGISGRNMLDGFRRAASTDFDISEATRSELQEFPGIGRSAANEIYDKVRELANEPSSESD